MAPSTTSTLHPIVIPPTHVSSHFTTIGTGLLHSSHARESVATLRTILFSDYPLSKPKPWWRAQCLLYGLDAPEKRTVDELRNTLRLSLLTNSLQVPPAMLALEQAENGKFRKLNAQVRDATSAGSKPRPAQKDPLKAVKSPTKVTKPVQPKAVKSPAKPAPKKATTSSKGLKVDVKVNVKVEFPTVKASARPKAAPKRAQRRR